MAASYDEIEQKVIKILAEQAMIDAEDVSGNSTLDDIGIDSLGLVETIFAIEEEFDISVPFNANQPDKGDFDISSVKAIAKGIADLMQGQTA